MRRLEQGDARALALRLAGDPRTARAHFALDIGGAHAWRTSDSRCFAVASPDKVGEVHIIGHSEPGEVIEFLRPFPLDARINLSRHMYAKLAGLVNTRKVRDIEVYAGKAGAVPSRIPPPRADFDIRSVLYSDLRALASLPYDATFLFDGYGDPREILARSVAFGAFNGPGLASLTTAEMGPSFASIWTYTVPELRGKGLATSCVAAVLDHLKPTGERPLFTIVAENGSPERAMTRRFGMELVVEMAQIDRRDMAL
jgi:GNAT superfamily N-acetyltransferase